MEEQHETIGSLGVPIFHKPQWKTVLGRPYNSMLTGERAGMATLIDETQECQWCDKRRSKKTSLVTMFY